MAGKRYSPNNSVQIDLHYADEIEYLLVQSLKNFLLWKSWSIVSTRKIIIIDGE